MKVKDLMIGDLVLVSGEISKVRKIHEYGVYLQDRNLYYGEDEIKPIPLNKEILEKNNDILYGELPILFDDGKMRYSIVECRYVSKEYERNGENFYCLLSSCVYNGGSFITPFAKIRYVHELQHALKLCGIEKEITL